MGHILQIQRAMSDSTRPMLEAFLVSSVWVTDRPEGMQKRGHGSGMGIGFEVLVYHLHKGLRDT